MRREPLSKPLWKEMHHDVPPHEREEKLPWEEPKSAAEDPDAPQRLQALMEHPNYRIADVDPDFLSLDAARGIRLQVDYIKTELLLNEYGIRHTIAVFGGTRIVEPSAAGRHLKEIEAALKNAPDDAALQKKHAVAKRILDKSRYYDVARELGRLIGMSGEGPGDCRVTLMTGGGPGIMEAANRGAFDVGAKSIGLNIDLPREQFPNPYITPELCFRFHYFSMRKLHFFQRSKALVAFPGGYGTMDELLEALTLVQTRKIEPFPIIMVGETFWREMINFERLFTEGVIDEEDMKLYWFAESAEEIWEGICEWYESSGRPLL